MTGMIDQLNSPAYSTAVGLLYWSMLVQESSPEEAAKGNTIVTTGDRVKRFFRMLLP